MSTDTAEGELDALGVGDHREQGVDALHLRVAQVVARPASHRVVPGDVELVEQVDAPSRTSGRRLCDANSTGGRTGRRVVLLVDAGQRGRRRAASGCAASRPWRAGVLPGVGVGLPGLVPGQRRSLVLFDSFTGTVWDRATD